MPIDSGIVFKVQIGAFKDEVPLDMANKFLKIAKKGIRNYNDENGLTIYSVGVFKTYDEAAKVKGDVATEAAINDAFIVAYKDGVKISVEDDARSLQPGAAAQCWRSAPRRAQSRCSPNTARVFAWSNAR